MVVTAQQGRLGPDLIQRLPDSFSDHLPIASRLRLQKPALRPCSQILVPGKISPELLILVPPHTEVRPVHYFQIHAHLRQLPIHRRVVLHRVCLKYGEQRSFPPGYIQLFHAHHQDQAMDNPALGFFPHLA